jgi:hypothetical protein
MGDFVNKKVKKKKDLADQMTLFKTQAKYNPKASKTESFSFYSDKRYIQEATEVYEVFKTQNKKLP